ncbi:MAG: alpha/beta hydrolase [Casimicrobiaceae bacterium]
MPNRQQATNAPSRWPSHRQWWIRTPDGVDISVREWGRPEGWPILFVHGLAQSHLSFLPQYASHLADQHRLIAYDLRGHGESAKPLDPAFYVEGRRWSDELQAVIDGVAAIKPILVGWSLGGRVLRQYLIDHGDRRIGGLNFVSTRPFEDPAVLAPASRANITGRPVTLAERIDAHIAFLRACFFRQPSEDDFAVALAYNVIVPQDIREAISGWSTGLGETRAALANVTVPTLIAHGRDDALILPTAAEMTAAAIKGSRISWYDDCGHSPFFEHAERFNRELDAFATTIKSQHVGERRS